MKDNEYKVSRKMKPLKITLSRLVLSSQIAAYAPAIQATTTETAPAVTESEDTSIEESRPVTETESEEEKIEDSNGEIEVPAEQA